MKMLDNIGARNANAVFWVSALAIIVGAIVLLLKTAGFVGEYEKMADISSAVLTCVGLPVNFLATRAKDLHADRRIEEAKARTAEAELALERETVERLALEERVGSRKLSPHQHEVLVARLQPLANTTIRVTLLSDQEAHLYGMNIVKAMKAAGLHVETMHVGVMSPEPSGLLVAGQGWQVLFDAFRAAQMQCGQGSASGPGLSLVVGKKVPF